MYLLPETGRKLAFSLVATLVLLAPAVAQALPVPPTFNWRASAPGTDPAQWNATVGTNQWTVSGTTSAATTTTFPGITGSFDMGTGDIISGVSFDSIAPGDPSNENMSLELWFRPASLSGGQQVLFETGGNQDGLALLLNNNTLTLRAKDSGTIISTSTTLAANAGEFYQAAITISLNGTASLYVDGIFQSSTPAAGLSDWSNGNGAGIGTRVGQLGSNSGSALNGYGDFIGEIALMRFYRDQVLSPLEVTQNFNAVATPEPGTAVLVALGLVGLAARRRRANR